ncbi:DUF362 domain-containing protein [uncultured Methanoregula sp.]|uniref:DUF362 domain-containing protein n=1 Tax=uncultured Methanoregula sp. TaxID=1005933 RepID=UPI002AAAE518|nr:DUF362 domain-containing protein [uncultured Methanoregula sp.]
MKPVFVNGVRPDVPQESLAACIRETFLSASDNCAWLCEGDVVLLKPALNSPDPFPSTTHPLAISVVAGALEDRGANVVIGDQSGIEHVLHHSGGVLRGGSRANYTRSGMGSPYDPRFVSFEDGGWDTGFFHHQSQNTSSWKSGFFITTWVKKADHIICLPRVSTHSQAGATLGLKCMVGMLREDSRMEFHANGPYNNFITGSAKGSTLVSEDDGSGRFFEKIVEISDAIREKLRLNLFVATKAQTTFGPDRYGIRVGPVGLGRAWITKPDPGLVFASADPVAAEAFALTFLKDLKTAVPVFPKLAERMILYQNPNVQDLQKIPVRDHPYIRHATEIGLGGMPHEVVYADVPGAVQERLNCYLK